jgi:hypothetical protein
VDTRIPRRRRRTALLLFVSLATNACIVPGVEAPPTAGYGEPFHGNGKAIAVKDGRSDWSISQGGEKLTSEQALEATGDSEYLARRREAKAFNDKVFAEGNANTVKANVMVYSGALMVLGGLAMHFFLANRLADRPITPGTDVDPDSRAARANVASETVRWGGLGLAALGLGAIIYGVGGSRGDPPYVAWKTPRALDRPAYVRQSTEAYNEKLGVASAPTQQAAVASTAVAPGQRATRPPPPSAPPAEANEADDDSKGETP